MKHLFILWEKSRHMEEKIVSDLHSAFRVLSDCEVRWQQDSFLQNMKRFYNAKQSLIDKKAKLCGTGPFRVLIVEDGNSHMKLVDTMSGPQFVNKNAFERKEKYRGWAGREGGKIHCTNTNEEFKKDCFLLFGEAFPALQEGPELPIIERQLTGSDGWESLRELLHCLNLSLEYVVLRNFQNFPDRYELDVHGDIDFLVRDKNQAVILLNATPNWRGRGENRVHYTVNIAGDLVAIDLRFVGDDYYPRYFQNDIIMSRILENGFYRPADKEFKYSLLYHALVHKNKVSADYLDAFENMFSNRISHNTIQADYLSEILDQFMRKNRYEYTVPEDKTVLFNKAYASRLHDETQRKRLSDRDKKKIRKSLISRKRKAMKEKAFIRLNLLQVWIKDFGKFWLESKLPKNDTDFKIIGGSQIGSRFETRGFPISNCRSFMELGAPMEQGKSNPFVETACLLLATPDLPAYETPLAEFFDRFQPKNAEELLGIDAESLTLKSLTPWEVQLPWAGQSGELCASRRARNMKEQAQQHGFTLDHTDGYNSFGPVTRQKLELEVESLRRLIMSIRESGYNEEGADSRPIARLLVAENGEIAINILEGNHRACVLAAMGYSEMSFDVETAKTVRESEILSWTGVKQGIYTENDARKVFRRFIIGEMPDAERNSN